MEALFEYDPAWTPRAAAVVCHPHPLFGGTMHNKVVYRAAKGAITAGLPTLRFNFRGVGASEGEYGDGVEEQGDVRAALECLSERHRGLPLCILGYSFGSAVGLAVGATDPRVTVLGGIGVPAGIWNMSFLRGVVKTTLIVQGTHDAFGPAEKVREVFDSLAGPKRLQWIDGAEHSFHTRLDQLQETVQAFLAEIV